MIKVNYNYRPGFSFLGLFKSDPSIEIEFEFKKEEYIIPNELKLNHFPNEENGIIKLPVYSIDYKRSILNDPERNLDTNSKALINLYKSWFIKTEELNQKVIKRIVNLYYDDSKGLLNIALIVKSDSYLLKDSSLDPVIKPITDYKDYILFRVPILETDSNGNITNYKILNKFEDKVIEWIED